MITRSVDVTKNINNTAVDVLNITDTANGVGRAPAIADIKTLVNDINVKTTTEPPNFMDTTITVEENGDTPDFEYNESFFLKQAQQEVMENDRNKPKSQRVSQGTACTGYGGRDSAGGASSAHADLMTQYHVIHGRAGNVAKTENGGKAEDHRMASSDEEDGKAMSEDSLEGKYGFSETQLAQIHHQT